MAKQMTKFESYISPILKNKMIRELILLPQTISGSRQSNKTEDYGVFKPSLVSHIETIAIYVTDLDISVPWYTEKLGFTLAGITEPTEHPEFKGQTIRCAYLNALRQKNTLVLIERTEINGKKIKPSTNSFFHIAFEVEDSRTSFEYAQRLREKGIYISYGPVKHNKDGDGESGGNVAVYFFDPDQHYLEFFYDMDTIDNYKQRYGNLKGSERV